MKLIVAVTLIGHLSGACVETGERKRPKAPVLQSVIEPAPLSVRDRILYASTGGIGLALPKVDLGTTLPKQIPAGENAQGYFRRILLPAMGASLAAGDFNGDGHTDLYVVVPGGSNHLFRNKGDNSFVDVTKQAGVTGNGDSLSAKFLDYDHSGHPSLLLTGFGGVTLYHNNGNGTFTNRTQAAGLEGKRGELDIRSAAGDIDNDGFPDLLVAAYADLNAPVKPGAMFPYDFAGVQSRLYRNNGNGTFTEITASAGLSGNPGRARNAVFADFNNDGRQDILLLREEKLPVVYLNGGERKFRDGTWEAGAAITRNAFLDAAAADFDHDGKTDLVLWSTVGIKVLMNCGSSRFDQAKSLFLVAPLAAPFGFHSAAADFNGDGFADLLVLDNEGKWRFFVNHGGQFQEAPVTLPAVASSGLKAVDWLIPVQWSPGDGVSLVAVQRDRQISVLTRQKE